MNSQYTHDLNIRAHCPDCDGAVTTFERRAGHNELGSIFLTGNHIYEGKQFSRISYRFFKCAGCGRGGLGKLHDSGDENSAILESFFPTSINHAKIPKDVPTGITSELREAELCASVSAWRAASALLRSTLEKTLRANGYAKGELERSNLQKKIDTAADDGVITAARKQKAHADIRVLGNDVLHDEWRKVDQDEVEVAHHYTQRILEDFYDDRPSVEVILKANGRLP